MKQFFLTLSVALCGYCSYAQTNTFPSSGNVGIGTTSPEATLGVEGTAQISGNLTFGTNSAYTTIGSAFAGAAIQFGQNSATFDRNLYLGFDGNGGYVGNGFYSALSIINQTGNVGIGTTSPGYKLEVAGGIGTRGGMGNGSTGQYYEVLPYEIATDNNAGWAGTMIGVRSGGMNSSSVPITQNITANATAYQQAWAMTFGTDKNQSNGSALSIWTGDATTAGTAMSEIFRVKSNGNVGINTTDTKGYMLAVNGSAIATSMTVKLYTDWPDYVFKPKYHLPSLTTVKAYIDKNQHLPDMPSEQEVKDNGINLGEIVKVQTKKIEELTLYLIEKDKQLNEQQAENKQQNQRIASLEAAVAKLTANSSK